VNANIEPMSNVNVKYLCQVSNTYVDYRANVEPMSNANIKCQANANVGSMSNVESSHANVESISSVKANVESMKNANVNVKDAG
jgi:hypothetical protein